MTITQTLLKAAAVSTLAVNTLVLPATLAYAADPRPLIITEVSGAARIQQGLPCGNTVDLTTPIARGYMQMSWLQITRGGEIMVDLTRLTMFLSPFHVEASCNGVRGFADFREIGANLASAIRFTARPTPEPGVFEFRIPKEHFLIYESVIDNAPVRQPETSYQRPGEDVTGVIDVRGQTVQLRVVLASELRFRAGCEGERCLIDETHRGTTVTEVRGGKSAAAPPAKRF